MTDNRKEIAIITGATSGIGAAFAKRFAGEGYDLIITGRRKEKIHALADELGKTFNINVDVVIAELSNPDKVDALAQKIRNTSNLCILVNNAGFATRGYFWEEDINGQENMVKVHILATIKLTHAAIPNMVAQGRGTIISLSSLGAFAPVPGNATYSGTKAFLSTFTESLHLELVGTGVKVQALCPGFTRTDFHERMGIDKSNLKDKGVMKWMSAEEVVEISLEYLEKNKVICIPGFWNKVLSLLPVILPHSLYYKMVSGFGSKK
jgi:short-subunit dehydrogenase